MTREKLFRAREIQRRRADATCADGRHGAAMPPRRAAGSRPEDGTPATSSKPDIVAVPAVADTRRSIPAKAMYMSPTSTCVEPDHEELIRSVSSVLQHRVRDNEQVLASSAARGPFQLPGTPRASCR